MTHPNRAEQAIASLTIEAANGVVRIQDGDDVFLVRETAYDASFAKLRAMAPYAEDEGGGQAYGDLLALCRGPRVCQSGDDHGLVSDRVALVQAWTSEGASDDGVWPSGEWTDEALGTLAREAATMGAHVELGRNGMGDDADEADFEAWVAYVKDAIDEATGMDVTVSSRAVREEQSNLVTTKLDRDDTLEVQAIERAIEALWEAFCADLSAWPVRIGVVALGVHDDDAADDAVLVDIRVTLGHRVISGSVTLVPEADGASFRGLGDEPSAWISGNILRMLNDELDERDFRLAAETIRSKASERAYAERG